MIIFCAPTPVVNKRYICPCRPLYHILGELSRNISSFGEFFTYKGDWRELRGNSEKFSEIWRNYDIYGVSSRPAPRSCSQL